MPANRMALSPGFISSAYPSISLRPHRKSPLCNLRNPTQLAKSRRVWTCSHSQQENVGFALADAQIRLFVELQTDAVRWDAPGAYAIRDKGGTLQYIGYSKNVGKKLEFHAELLPHLCNSFQTYIPKAPVEEITPDMLEGVLEYWVRENGFVPVGNTRDRGLWEGTAPSRQVLLGAIFALFFFSSLLKQVLYFTTSY